MGALLSGLSVGLGALGGGLSNTTAARTSTTNQNYGSSNTGSSTPTYNPLQSGMQGSVASALQNEITNGVNTTPASTAGTANINQTYEGIGDRLQQSLASRGMGNSGASGTAALQTNLARAGAVGNLQSQLQASAIQQQQTALGQAMGFGFTNPGTTGASSTSGNAYGTSVGPGSVAAGVVGGAGTSLMNLLNAASNNKSGTSLLSSLFG